MDKVKNIHLKNKYKLERKIARGGMSDVYICTNIELGNQWIAKHIDKRYESFIYEEEILKKLNHISLPKIIDVCREESGVYIIESYIEGISLQKKLENLGKLNIDKVIDYSLQLCEVLLYLHNLKPKAIVHRDLKPANIIITEYDKLVLIDFGISQEKDRPWGSLKAGTSAYAPTEQLTGASQGDTRWDIYSLGIVMYQMLTGQLPGECVMKAGRTPLIYKKLLEISEKCSRTAVEERYQRVEDIKRDLMALRNKYILINERNRLKRKTAIILIAVLSLINYLCLLAGLILL